MIVSKPKTNTFFALGMFLLLIYAASIYLLYDILSVEEPSLWLIILFVLLLVIALVVSFKFLNSYQTVRLEKNRIEVRRVFGLSKSRLYFKELQFWKEETVKTSNGVFKQISAVFGNNKKFRLANQENDNYEKIAAHFRKNYAKKQQSK
ncbi:MAG: hypothetical protein ACLFUB_03290 [Cyclobacteriaceae bacterium]